MDTITFIGYLLYIAGLIAFMVLFSELIERYFES